MKLWIINIQIKFRRFKQHFCKHEKGEWLDRHCGVDYYECKKCGYLMMYLPKSKEESK